METPTYRHVRTLEGLRADLQTARDRKRKRFTLHPDEYGPIIEALAVAAPLADQARLEAMHKDVAAGAIG